MVEIISIPHCAVVASDETSILRSVRTILANHGGKVYQAQDANQALRLIEAWNPDIVLVDFDQFYSTFDDFCVRIHAFSNMPLIALIDEDDQDAIIMALEYGADDYLTKPLHANELLGRISANLLRARRSISNVRSIDAILDFGQLVIDTTIGHSRCNSNKLVLTSQEYRLLVYMARNPGRILTHEELLRHVWGSATDVALNTIKVAIARLRSKLQCGSEGTGPIVSRRGLGYSFEPGLCSNCSSYVAMAAMTEQSLSALS